jgi:putative spermidine/putrescine transport system ATP-binding protein
MGTVSLGLERITKRFGSVTAVQDFSLKVEEGEFVSLLGPSGCGKTTILRCIAGFERPDTGQVYLYGQVVNDVPPERRDVGMVFQAYALFPNMTVGQNIAFPLMIKGSPKVEQRQRVAELLDLVQLRGLEERYPRQLSGGQQQRVALARALAKRPKVLLLDEPLSALDAKIREELRIEIRRIQTTLGITTIYVTHDQEEALSISDRVVVMNQGIIQQVGSPAEIYKRPATLFVARFVGTNNLFQGKIGEGGRFLWRDHVFRVDDAIKWPSGIQAVLAVRPAAMGLATSQTDVPSGANVMLGRIEPLTFLGSIVRVSLRVQGDEMIRVDLPAEATAGLSLGQQVYVYFSPEAGVIVREQ